MKFFEGIAYFLLILVARSEGLPASSGIETLPLKVLEEENVSTKQHKVQFVFEQLVKIPIITILAFRVSNWWKFPKLNGFVRLQQGPWMKMILLDGGRNIMVMEPEPATLPGDPLDRECS